MNMVLTPARCGGQSFAPVIRRGFFRGRQSVLFGARQGFCLGRSRLRTNAGRRGAAGQSFSLAKIVLITLFIVGAALLSLFYLSQTNQAASKGYVIRDLEERLAVIENENNALELKAAELQSLQKIEEDLSRSLLVKTESVSYIETTTLAQR